MKITPFVLLVEDDDRLRKVISHNLAAHGYLVLQANSVYQAIECISIKPRLAILDIHLPDGTAWDVADWMKSQSCIVPAIIISAVAPRKDLLAGMPDSTFLQKPFEMKKLLGLVDRYTAA